MSTITTNYGQVKGLSKKTDDGKEYTAYYGIPYAKQPLNELRFRDPQPLEAWNGVFDATREGSAAIQAVWFNPTGDPNMKTMGTDNCLILNVYTPKVDSLTGKLPVYVYIHGGGYSSGSSSTMTYGPDYLVEEDIIVVTLNYRLGIVGFLSFKDETLGIPGNAALKDQCMALKWVKENIEHFGGDSKNITVAGESAGAASLHFQLISPMSKGLFNRAIVQSGSAYNPWAIMPEDESYEHALAVELGWNGQGGDRGAYEVIASTDVAKLVLTALEFVKDKEKKMFGPVVRTPFIPRVEPYNSKMCFLPKDVIELAREAWSNEIDVIIGGNKDEGILFHFSFDECAPMLEKNFKLLIPYQLRRTMNETQKAAAAIILKNIYFWKEDINLSSKDKYTAIIGDLTFWHGIHRHLLQRYFKGGSGKTYHYLLSTSPDPELKFYKIIRQLCRAHHNNGTCHADDLPLIFKSIFSGKPTSENQIYPTFDKYFSAYTSFIKTGNPNNAKLGLEWKTVGEKDSDQEGLNCLNFYDDGIELAPSPLSEKLLVWDSIYDQENLV